MFEADLIQVLKRTVIFRDERAYSESCLLGPEKLKVPMLLISFLRQFASRHGDLFFACILFHHRLYLYRLPRPWR